MNILFIGLKNFIYIKSDSIFRNVFLIYIISFLKLKFIFHFIVKFINLKIKKKYFIIFL